MTSATGSSGGGVAAPAAEPPTPATSLVQLAAASLVRSDGTNQSAELKSRSQKLKEEIDRLKSSIPVCATIVRQQSETSREPTKSTTTSRKEALRQQRQLRDSGAPLASLDCSITIASSSCGGGGPKLQEDQNNNNNNNNNHNDNSCASFDSTIASGLSGYFECDELSDMVDDSLFELTNAGCLSRSVFPRQDKMSTGRAGPLPLEDGERTPTNQVSERQRRRVTTISSDSNVQQHYDHDTGTTSGPEAMAHSHGDLRPVESHDIRSNTSSRVKGEPTTTISSTSSSSSSLVAQDHHSRAPQGDKIAKPPAGRKRGTTTKEATTSQRSQISSGVLEPGERQKRVGPDQNDDSPPSRGGGGGEDARERLVLGKTSQLRHHRREGEKLDGGKRRQATTAKSPSGAGRRTARSQSNSMLAEGAATARRQKAVNSRCPICCEQAAAVEQSNHNNNNNNSKQATKKPAAARKRRFTFSLFNLFTGGGGSAQGAPAENGRDEDDGDDEMSPQHQRGHPVAAATCQHGYELSASAQDSIRVATAPAHSYRRARQSASAKGGVSGATPTDSDSPRLPVRLRDSIKITNQRKARHQSQRVASRANAPTARVSSNGPGPGGAQSNAGELLLDLSTGGGGQHLPTPAASGTTKGKCVKFTTPDRVLILSPTPSGDIGDGASTSRRPPPVPRLPASASLTAGLASSCSPASIIKRSTPGGIGGVPKSSSYSQTEPNKGLDELLARYERDTNLVAAINEKLHLTETIASNRAALDSLEASEPSQGKPEEEVDSPDDIDEQLLEVARQQRQLANKSSSSFTDDTGETAAANGCEEREDFSRCNCLGESGAAANKRRKPTDRQIRIGGGGGGGGSDNETPPAAASKRTLSAPATGSDRSKLISDLTLASRGEGENMIRANGGGGGAVDPNAENNQIYERHRRHRQRADTATTTSTRRARAFAAPDSRHSSSLDQAAAASVARHRRASGNSQPAATAATEDEATPRDGFSREWLGKQTRAFV